MAEGEPIDIVSDALLCPLVVINRSRRLFFQTDVSAFGNREIQNKREHHIYHFCKKFLNSPERKRKIKAAALACRVHQLLNFVYFCCLTISSILSQS